MQTGGAHRIENVHPSLLFEQHLNDLGMPELAGVEQRTPTVLGERVACALRLVLRQVLDDLLQLLQSAELAGIVNAGLVLVVHDVHIGTGGQKQLHDVDQFGFVVRLRLHDSGGKMHTRLFVLERFVGNKNRINQVTALRTV